MMSSMLALRRPRATWSRRWIAVATALSLSLPVAVAPITAFAEPSAADKETARSLMSDGREKRDKGDHAGALKSFLAAHAIMRVPTTGLEVGREQETLGQLVEAHDTFLSIVRMPVEPGEPKPFAAARKEAGQRAEAIADRIPSLNIVITGAPAGAQVVVLVDGETIPSAALDVPRKVDPGSHSVVVKVSGAERTSSVEVAERETKEVDVAFSSEDFPATTPVDGPKPDALDKLTDEPANDPVADVAPAPEPHSNTLLYVGIATTGAGLLVGSITGLMSASKTSSLKSSCTDGHCPPALHDDLSSARSLATISTISFAVAGVGALVTVYGLLSRPSSPEPAAAPSEARAHVSVWIGLGSAGLAGAF